MSSSIGGVVVFPFLVDLWKGGGWAMTIEDTVTVRINPLSIHPFDVPHDKIVRGRRCCCWRGHEDAERRYILNIEMLTR